MRFSLNGVHRYDEVAILKGGVGRHIRLSGEPITGREHRRRQASPHAEAIQLAAATGNDEHDCQSFCDALRVLMVTHLFAYTE